MSREASVRRLLKQSQGHEERKPGGSANAAVWIERDDDRFFTTLFNPQPEEHLVARWIVNDGVSLRRVLKAPFKVISARASANYSCVHAYLIATICNPKHAVSWPSTARILDCQAFSEKLSQRRPGTGKGILFSARRDFFLLQLIERVELLWPLGRGPSLPQLRKQASK